VGRSANDDIIYEGVPGLMTELESESVAFAEAAYAEGSVGKITTATRAYFDFCKLTGIHFHLQPGGITDDQLNRFISWLARRVQYKTVKAYISMGVRLVHEAAGITWRPPGSRFSTSLVLRGVKRLKGDRTKPKHAVTIELLRAVIAKLDMSGGNKDDLSFGTACLILFFCFLRKAHATVHAGRMTNQTIRRGDISRSAAGDVILSIFYTKTIQFEERALRYKLPAMQMRQDRALCPMEAVLRLLRATAGRGGDDDDDALFMQNYDSPNGPSPLSYDHFLKRFKATIAQMGLDPADYAGHSFRRGGATFAKDAGMSDEVIKAVGDWKSDAYQLYTAATARLRERAADLLADAVARSRELPPSVLDEHLFV
jgi:hypothetical protein